MISRCCAPPFGQTGHNSGGRTVASALKTARPNLGWAKGTDEEKAQIHLPESGPLRRLRVVVFGLSLGDYRV